MVDPYEESQYSAVHYDMKVVTQMIQATISEKRSSQQFILLEGVFNTRKLEDESDRLVLRSMDELFTIEKNIGEIAGVIGLQFNVEKTVYVEEKWEVFDEPVVEEKKAKIIDEEGNEVDAPEPVPAEGDEPKAPKFNPADFKWTVTNKNAKNLPQIFRDYKGMNCHTEETSFEKFSLV